MVDWAHRLERAIDEERWGDLVRCLLERQSAAPAPGAMDALLSRCLGAQVGQGDFDGALQTAERLTVETAIAAWRDAGLQHPIHDGKVILQLVALASHSTEAVAVDCVRAIIHLAEYGQEDWRLAEAVPVFMSLLDALMCTVPASWLNPIRVAVVPALARWGSFDQAFDLLSHVTFPDDSLYSTLAREQARRGLYDTALETADWIRDSVAWLKTRVELMLQREEEVEVMRFIEHNPRLSMPGRAPFVLDAAYLALAESARKSRRYIQAERYAENIRNDQHRAQAQVLIRVQTRGAEAVVDLIPALGPLVKTFTLATAIGALCQKGDREGAAALLGFIADRRQQELPALEVLRACARNADVDLASQLRDMLGDRPDVLGEYLATLVSAGRATEAVDLARALPPDAHQALPRLVHALLLARRDDEVKQMLPRCCEQVEDVWAVAASVAEVHPEEAGDIASLVPGLVTLPV